MPQPDVIATAAQSASAVAVSVAASAIGQMVVGPANQIEMIEIWVGVIAAFASAFNSRAHSPSYTQAYVIGALSHVVLALVAGLAASRLAPAWFEQLREAPSWSIVAAVSGLSHYWMPAIGPALDAVTVRIAGRPGEPNA